MQSLPEGPGRSKYWSDAILFLSRTPTLSISPFVLLLEEVSRSWSEVV
jgi:hypothetical protein